MVEGQACVLHHEIMLGEEFFPSPAGQTHTAKQGRPGKYLRNVAGVHPREAAVVEQERPDVK